MKIIRHYLYKQDEIFKRKSENSSPETVTVEILPYRALNLLNSRKRIAIRVSRSFMYNELNSKGEIKVVHIFYRIDSRTAMFHPVEDGIVDTKTYIRVKDICTR